MGGGSATRLTNWPLLPAIAHIAASTTFCPTAMPERLDAPPVASAGGRPALSTPPPAPLASPSLAKKALPPSAIGASQATHRRPSVR